MTSTVRGNQENFRASEIGYYLQHVSAQVGQFGHPEGDFQALGFDATPGLDLVGLVTAVVADRCHDHNFLEMRDAWNTIFENIKDCRKICDRHN